MVEEKKPKTKAQSDQLSDSDTPDEEADPRLRTSEEERSYGTIRGSAQATQAALSHSRVQTNPTETENKEITQRQSSRKGHPD